MFRICYGRTSPTIGGKDHPRSRGVYMSRISPSVRAWGSSPLARGLRHRVVHRELDPGIIPARAGFTLSRPALRARRRDHPRSRGVYRSLRSLRRRRQGSSPLARGLPGADDRLVGGQRIIPARAGFTTNSPGRRTPTRDHPRSRGVYAVLVRTRPERHGSSPLARGLRNTRPGKRKRGGIIPARAGFTGARSRS